MPPSLPPARAYYEACQGRWRAPMELTVTDPAALRTSGMGLARRMQLRALSGWPRWLGRFTLDTTVAFEGNVVVHTTAIRWLGLPLATTVERFELLPDGQRIAVTGGTTGDGEVEPCGTRATYALTWLGAPLRMTTHRTAHTVEIAQEGPGWRGRYVLERRGD